MSNAQLRMSSAQLRMSSAQLRISGSGKEGNKKSKKQRFIKKLLSKACLYKGGRSVKEDKETFEENDLESNLPDVLTSGMNGYSNSHVSSPEYSSLRHAHHQDSNSVAAELMEIVNPSNIVARSRPLDIDAQEKAKKIVSEMRFFIAESSDDNGHNSFVHDQEVNNLQAEVLSEEGATSLQAVPLQESFARDQELTEVQEVISEEGAAPLHSFFPLLEYPETSKKAEHLSPVLELGVASSKEKGNEESHHESFLKFMHVADENRTEDRKSYYIAYALQNTALDAPDLDKLILTWQYPDPLLNSSHFENIEKIYRNISNEPWATRKLLFDKTNTALMEIFRPYTEPCQWLNPAARRVDPPWKDVALDEALIKIHEEMDNNEADMKNTEKMFERDTWFADKGHGIEMVVKEIEGLMMDDLINEVLTSLID